MKLPKKILEHWLPATAILLISALLGAPIAWWLTRPAANGTIAVVANTGSLTMEVMCGERLIWDLPPGNVISRSSTPGTSPLQLPAGLTLALTGGALVAIGTNGAGVLSVTIGRSESMTTRCGAANAAVYQASSDGQTLEPDSIGISFVSLEGHRTESRRSIDLPLSGHLRLGEVVQQGAGWSNSQRGILESGTATLRVVPSFSDERVTLSTERLDEGSLFDTHGCLSSPHQAMSPCPSSDAVPAIGFARFEGERNLRTHLYARGPVGVQVFGSTEQQLIRIPNSISAWQSEVLKIWGGFALVVLSLWKYLMDFFRFVTKTYRNPKVLHEVFLGESKEVEDGTNEVALDQVIEPPPKHAAGLSERGNDEALPVNMQIPKEDASEAKKSWVVLIISASVLMGLGFAPRLSHAEPVEIKQEGYTGSGFTFRRGSACLALTAHHVVKEIGVPITVLDRSGAKVVGTRTYANEAYDLALVTLPESATIACTTTWPDSSWLRKASFGGKGEFRAIRHYPSGQEVLVYLKYAGGDKDHLSLAPADALTIRESDSGSIVEFEGKLIGIVQSVATDTGRIKMLRFDRIDDLLSDRFRGAAGGRVVSFAGVFHQGRPNPNWSTYIQAWITEKSGRTVIPTAAAANVQPKPSCDVKVDVVAWEHVQAPNPERDALDLQEKACTKKGAFFEMLCKQAKTAKSTAPASVLSQKLSANLTITPAGAQPITKLVQSTLVPPNARMTQSELENATLQAALGPPLGELLSQGGCN